VCDQVDLGPRDLRSSKGRSASPSPIQSEALLVPPDNCFGLEDEKRLFPRVACIGRDAEEEPIERSQSGSRGRTREYFQLLSEKEVLEPDLRWRFEKRKAKREEGSDHQGVLFCSSVQNKGVMSIRIRYLARGWNFDEGHVGERSIIAGIELFPYFPATFDSRQSVDRSSFELHNSV
jgi:hypothetical protein